MVVRVWSPPGSGPICYTFSSFRGWSMLLAWESRRGSSPPCFVSSPSSSCGTRRHGKDGLSSSFIEEETEAKDKPEISGQHWLNWKDKWGLTTGRPKGSTCCGFEEPLVRLDRDTATYGIFLRECSSRKDHAEGKQLHARTGKSEFNADLFLANRLILMYSKCKNLIEAHRIFQNMPVRNVVSWNVMIGGYAQHGRVEEAIQLFQEMQMDGFKPDRITFIHVLNVCASQGFLPEGKLAHAHIVDRGLDADIVLGTALINMYGKCESIMDARMKFESMHKRDVVLWNAMISAYALYGHAHEAFRLFQKMHQEDVKLDIITVTSVLTACVSPEHLAMGKLVHAYTVGRGYDLDVLLHTALVSMYGKCGDIQYARSVFDDMPEPDVVLWTAIITAYSQHGYGDEAFKLFHQMQRQFVKPDKITFINILNACASPEDLVLGKLVHAHIVDKGVESDVFVGAALVKMYGKSGSIQDACRVFEKMPERNVLAWNAIIGGYARHEQGNEVFWLFQQMQQQGIKPNKTTFIGILTACASPEAMALGELAHAKLVEGGFALDVVVGNALVSMYGKCGSIENACRVFEKMPNRDLVSWTVMLAAFAQHGCGKESIWAFEQMQREGLKPNVITLVNMLNACSHAGLVDEGLGYFHSMKQEYGITPTMEHYNCIVDLLGRAGLLDEAEDFINKMPFQPDAVIWMTFLGCCRLHGCTNQGKCAAENAVKLDPQLHSAYVVLSNIYAAAGEWDDVAKVRKLMADKAVKKEPGHSWIEVNNRIHDFVVGDRSHPQTEEIYAELERLTQQMKLAGYVPDTNLVLYDVEEEQKEHLLCCHSEKLAITFGLISTPYGTPLRITKSLRVCVDCHKVAKYISKNLNREIVLRDANRFHHFRGGVCTCGDYW